MDDNNIHIVLNAISVGNDFFILAQIKSDEVIIVRMWNCHISIPNNNPGMIIIPFAHHAQASMILKSVQYSFVKNNSYFDFNSFVPTPTYNGIVMVKNNRNANP
jgi:hypothetical protein